MKNKLVFYFDVLIVASIAVLLALTFFPAFRNFAWWHAANIAVAAVASVPTFIAMFKTLAKLRITLDVFSAIALGGAFYFSSDIRSVEYIILMLLCGRLVDHFTQARAKDAIAALLDLKPASARVVEGETEKQVDLESVRAGDMVIVENGEKIPVDGVVEKGEGMVNEAPLSGESRQILKRPGDSVYAATINENGILYIRTKQVGTGTMLAKIIELVRNAQAVKAPTQRAADRFAAWFLPVSLAAVGAVLYFTGDIAKSIALLLVICADEIVVATPLAMFAGITAVARDGIIIKGGVYLEALSGINAVVLDQTGTLTYGRQEVSFIRTFWGVSEDALMSLAAMAEKHSEHPLARTILAYARRRNIHYDAPDTFEAVNGKGVKVKHKGMDILAGSKHFIHEHNVHIQEEVAKHIADEEVKGVTPVVVAQDVRIIGVISVTDAPRLSAKEAIKKIHELGIADIVMMTGDNEDAAGKTAGFLGIDVYYARMLPEDTFRKVKEMVDGGKRVVMVGDGVNDAPALSAAHVGIAMGAIGTDIAIEAADITLMNDQLEKIPETISLSRRVMGVIRGNIWLWVASNVVGISLVLMGMLGPVGAAVFNFLTNFIPLGNSLRLFNWEK